MTPPDVWQCGWCCALNARPACRVCGHAADEAPPDFPPRPRTIVSVPRRDFPYARTHRAATVNRSLFAPAALLLTALLLAAGFEPVASEIAFANVPGATIEYRQRVRQGELQRAARSLRELDQELRRALEDGGDRLSTSWKDRLDSVKDRHRLHGERTESPFADQEVALRAVALELASLHHRYVAGALADDVLPRLDAAEHELARVMEDLTHVR